MADDIHIIPLNDYKPHIESKECFCNPTETEEGVFVHHSLDGREKIEQIDDAKILIYKNIHKK